MAKHRNNTRNTLKAKRERGETRSIEKKPSMKDGWNLEWFHPSPPQQLIIDSIECNDITVVQGSSGTGKTSTAVYKALLDYRAGVYNQVLFIKTPAESGTDPIGALKGEKNDKIAPHCDASEGVFLDFMPKEKLRNDRSSGNIVLDIPNFLQGKTFEYSIIILEESQNMNPATVKLCSERAGRGSKVVIIGDSHQTYGIKRREDGLKDFIRRVTKDYHGHTVSNYPSKVGYIEMTPKDNMRSDLSRFITELYEGGD